MATRRERVILDIESDLARTLTKDAVAAAFLARELDKLGKVSLTNLSKASRDVSRNTGVVAADVDKVGVAAKRTDSSINQLTGRLRVMAEVSAMLGPALIPVGALAVPAVAGLANQLGVAALAGGTAIIAFQGVGDALKAVNEAAIEPTAANLEAAREAMEALSPAAQEMVTRLQELRPVLSGLRDAAAEGMFPGLIEGLDELETRVPELERILTNMSSALGDLMADAGESLASSEWDEFFNYLATEAPKTLTALGQTVGSLTHGLAELWMAFTPLNRDFSDWMLDVSRGFDGWASGLAKTEGFREFIDYIRDTGPQVAETFGALGNAILQIVQAAAPLAGPVLGALKSLADIIAAIADSPVGMPLMSAVVALSAWNRASAVWTSMADSVQSGFDKVGVSSGRTASALSAAGSAAAIVAGALIIDAAVDSWDDAELSARQLQKTMSGLALGTITADLDNLTWSAESFGDALHQVAYADSQPFGNAKDEIEALDKALADLAINSPRQAEKAWRTIVREGEAAGVAIEDLTKLFPELHLQLDQTGTHAKDLEGMLAGGMAPAASKAGGAVKGLADNLDDAAGAALTFKGALAELNGLLDKRDAMRNYQDSVEALGKTVEEFGPNSREAAQGFDDIARNIGVMASHMKGAAKVEFLTKATRDLEAFGRQLGLPPKLMRPVIQSLYDAMAAADKATGAQEDLIREYHLTPKQVDTLIKQSNMGASQADIRDLLKQYGLTPKEIKTAVALLGVAAAEGAINHLTRPRTITVTVNQRGGVTSSAGGHSVDAPAADGTTVPKTGLPYADRHPYMLADGEEVTSNRYGQADAFRPVLKGINANLPRSIIKGMLAAGGTAGGDRATSYLDLTRADLALSTFARTVDSATRATKSNDSAQKSHERRLKALTKAFDEQKTVVDEARSALQQLKQDANAFSESVAGNFNGDSMFQANDAIGFSAWDALRLSLTNQTAQANAFEDQLRDAKRSGLSGGLFNYIAQSGDYGLASEFAGMSRAEIRAAEQLYRGRNQAAASVGQFAGNAAYGADIKAQTAEVRQQTRELRELKASVKRQEQIIKRLEHSGPERTGEAVGREINSAASAGKRRRG